MQRPTERDVVRVWPLEDTVRPGQRLRVVRDLVSELEDLALELLDVALPLARALHERVRRPLRPVGVALELDDVTDRPFELGDDALDADVSLVVQRGQLPDMRGAAIAPSRLEGDPRAGQSSDESAHRADTEPTLRACAHRGDDHRGGPDDRPGEQIGALL